MADIPNLLDNPTFRRSTARRLANAQVRDFWLSEYEGYSARFRSEAIAPLQNKVGAFLADPVLQRILIRPKSSFYPRSLMDNGGILIANLAKGRMGQDSSRLLGALLLSRICLAALSRADQLEPMRRDFIAYLDEFQNYATPELAVMLSELRKYRLALVLAHQYQSQLHPDLRDAILGKRRHHGCLSPGGVRRRSHGQGVLSDLWRIGHGVSAQLPDLPQAHDLGGGFRCVQRANHRAIWRGGPANPFGPDGSSIMFGEAGIALSFWFPGIYPLRPRALFWYMDTQWEPNKRLRARYLFSRISGGCATQSCKQNEPTVFHFEAT